ncbi:MAG: hypothetical protein ACK5TU_00355 [Cyclobacteriaceae bacterium]
MAAWSFRDSASLLHTSDNSSSVNGLSGEDDFGFSSVATSLLTAGLNRLPKLSVVFGFASFGS